MKPRWTQMVLLLVVALASCSPSSNSSRSGAPVATTSGGVMAAPPVASTVAAPVTAPAPAPRAVTSAEPLPAFGELRSIFLRQEQGGPSIRRCRGVSYEIELDLVANSFIYRLCDSEAKGPPGSEALTRRSGKLGSARKADIEQAYAKLTHEPARGCGKDGGTLSLTVTHRSGKTERWVDQNWGCVKPPPEVANGLREFMMAATAVMSGEQ